MISLYTAVLYLMELMELASTEQLCTPLKK